MNVPKEFQIAGLKVTIESNNELIKTRSIIGEAKYNDQKIVLDLESAPTETVEQAFLHELVHWILYVMNEDELRNNEKHVDLFAHLLYQSLKTGGFGLEEDTTG
jgi:hypothetical protein